MPRQEGLRPIGESVKKIIEKIKKEREERQKKSSSPKTQPKLPGMKNGGGADARNPSIREYANIIKDKDKVTEADIERSKKRLSTETGRAVAREKIKDMKKMKKGGGVDMGDPKKPVAIPTGKDPEIMIHNLRPSDDPDFRAYAGPRRTGKDKIEKLKADLKKKPMKKMATGGITEDDSEFSRREKEKLPLPQKPTMPKPTRPPMMPQKKKDDKGYNKTKNQPKSDFGVEYAEGRPSRPGKNIIGYSLKKGGLTGGQKKLDANKDGKISGEDFKILRGKQNKMRGGGIAIKGTNFKGVF